MNEIHLTVSVIIQVCAVIVAVLGFLAGLFKSKLEALLLSLMFGLSMLYGWLHLSSTLKVLSPIIPGFDIFIDQLRVIDPRLVATWANLTEWMMFVVSALIVWGMFIAFRLSDYRSNVIRGAQLLTYEKMMRQLKVHGQSKIPILIGQFFIPEKIVSRSLVLVGEPGTGKTLIILRLILSYFKQGEVLFCVDIGGDIYRKLGKSEDEIVAPTYKNSVEWSPFSEIKNLSDCKAPASMMVDKAKGESGTWDQKAIEYTADLLSCCVRSQLTTNKDLIYLVRFATQKELEEFLKGTSSMRLFEVGSGKMLSNIQSIVSQSLSFFDLLDPNAGANAFSFRNWARNRKENLWLINDESSKEITLPLRRVGVSLIIRESLDMGENRSRRINVILDELPANGRIASLQNALAQGRKYGLNFHLGFQSLALFYSVYSKDEAHAILGSAGQSVVLRTPDAETAEYYSKAIGDSVTEREQVSVSKPNNGVTRQRIRETQRAVMPIEIQSLQDLNGYMRFAGIGWSKIKIPIVKLENKNKLIPKNFDDGSTGLTDEPKNSNTTNDNLDEI